MNQPITWKTSFTVSGIIMAIYLVGIGIYYTVCFWDGIMEKLKTADEVAYVRFASVYRQFKDINTFMEELNKLLKEK